VDTEPLRQVDAWLDRYRGLWTQRLDALETELARGRLERRARRSAPTSESTEPGRSTQPDDPRGIHTP
jgi:hypothetical protein